MVDQKNPPSIVNFHDEDLHKSCFAGFEHMRRRGKLCDVTLISQTKRFAAHKIVLAATIPFFNGMFLSNMAESNKNEISMFGLDPCALEAFIAFAYTGTIQITPCNVQSLLIGASFLHLASIRNICCKYIEERLSPSTVLTVRDFAQSFMCNNLAAACDNYILDHFDSVSRTEAFLKISGNELLTWLASDDLCISSEEQLFQLVVDWVEYEEHFKTEEIGTEDDSHLEYRNLSSDADKLKDSLACDIFSQQSDGLFFGEQFPRSTCPVPPLSDTHLPFLHGSSKAVFKEVHSRLSLLPDLLKRVRLPLIPASFISSVISKHKLIRENIACRDLLDEVRDMLLLRDRTASSFSCRPRRGQETFGIIYAVGGLTANGDCHGIVETYHPSLGRWELAENMPSQRSRIGVVALNGRLYAIGGFDGTARLNTTEMYDPKTKVWRSLAPMICRRSALGAATLDGRIYVCGGYDGVASLRACEAYNPAADRWVLIPTMNEARSAGGLVALSNGYLYAVGGHNGLAIYSSVECYNQRASGPSPMCHNTTGDGSLTLPSRYYPSNPWQRVARMIHRRCRHGVAALRNRIIVAGGYNGVTFLRSVEVFDPAAGPDSNGVMGQWTEIAPLGVPRSRVGLAVTGGRLYAIGGYDGITHLRTVECFHPCTNDYLYDMSVVGDQSNCVAELVKHGNSVRQPETSGMSCHNVSVTTTTSYNVESSLSISSEEEDAEDETSSVSTASNSTTTNRSHESQTVSQLESHSVFKCNRRHRLRPSNAAGAFVNWTWTPAAPLIAHQGWVGVGVLPLDDTSTDAPVLAKHTHGTTPHILSSPGANGVHP